MSDLSNSKEPEKEEILEKLKEGAQATDPVQLFAEVLEQFDNHDKWINAPLAKIKIISNTKVGSVGQVFVERLCDEFQIPIEFPVNKQGKRATQSPWDVKIASIEFELKTATEDISGNFQFNHIRYHRPYQAVMCLGVSPDDLYFGLWTKAEVVTGKAGALVSMEKGANASYKLTKKAANLHPIADFANLLAAFIEKYAKENE